MAACQVEFGGGLLKLPVFKAPVFADSLLAQLGQQLDAPSDLEGVQFLLLDRTLKLGGGVLDGHRLLGQAGPPSVEPAEFVPCYGFGLGKALQCRLTLLQECIRAPASSMLLPVQF